MLFEQFKMAEEACNICRRLARSKSPGGNQGTSDGLAGYDQRIKASHVFNLLTPAASSR